MFDDLEVNVGGPDSLRGALLVLLLGVGTAGFGAYDYTQQTDAVENAVAVNATIVGTDVGTTSGGRRGGVEYSPEATFEYRYDGESYTSGEVFPATVSHNYDTRSAAEAVLSGYETGETVTAYVDPDSPGDAFLKKETTNAPLWLVGFGAIFAIVGVVSAVRNR